MKNNKKAKIVILVSFMLLVVTFITAVVLISEADYRKKLDNVPYAPDAINARESINYQQYNFKTRNNYYYSVVNGHYFVKEDADGKLVAEVKIHPDAAFEWIGQDFAVFNCVNEGHVMLVHLKTMEVKVLEDSSKFLYPAPVIEMKNGSKSILTWNTVQELP